MQGYMDNQQVTDNNATFSIAVKTVLGDREDQQDCFGYELMQDEGIVVLCDGMGGYEGGKVASNTAVECFLSEYSSSYPCDDEIDFLYNTTLAANRKICELITSSGKLLNAGSTVVAVMIRNGNLFWSSVGDSRAYLLRNDEFVQFTKDQNYRTVLSEKLTAGLIDEEQFNTESSRAEALISFLGIGKLDLIDYNKEAFPLLKDDKILIMSDGLYKILSDEEIARIVGNFSNISEALEALEMKVKKYARVNNICRDNMTVAIIKIH